MTTTEHHAKRDEYGALHIAAQCGQPSDVSVWRLQEVFKLAKGLLSAASKAKLIPAEFDSMKWQRISSRVGSKRVGEAIHHDLYDVTPDGRYALVCVREVEGTRYGIATKSKTYFLVSRYRTTAKVAEVPKHLPAKAAKAAGTQLGPALVSVADDMDLGLSSVKTIKMSSRSHMPLTQEEEEAAEADRVQRRMSRVIAQTVADVAIRGAQASDNRRQRAML